MSVVEGIDLRLGRWQDALAGVEPDALITDPPFSERTAKGFVSGTLNYNKANSGISYGVSYGSITEADAREIAESWAPRTKLWAIIFGDHISYGWHEAAWKSEGWYTFPPVAYVKQCAVPRLAGDGPSSACEWIMAARRRGVMDGCRPGYYLATTVRHGHGHTGVTGQKDLNIMRAIVRDYAPHGGLVVDPFCGSGTTALACALEHRRCMTTEMDAGRHEIARRRLSNMTPELPGMDTAS